MLSLGSMARSEMSNVLIILRARLSSVRLVVAVLSVVGPFIGFAHPNDAFTLHEPNPTRYEWVNVPTEPVSQIQVKRAGNSELVMSFLSTLILHTKAPLNPDQLAPLIESYPCQYTRSLTPQIHVFDCPSAQEALIVARALGTHPEIYACYPSRKQPLRRLRPYAAQPNDRYFERQWYLENRNPATGRAAGLDLNIRSAWPVARGRGITISIVDDGVDLAHPDFAHSAETDLHQDFVTGNPSGNHRVTFHAHGTAVAGLALAQAGDGIGMIGAAPESELASWIIFDTDDTIVDSVALADVFLYENERVAVQNHSWGNGLVELLGPTFIEHNAVSNAVYHSRGGRGVVMVRAGGNSREEGFEHPGGGDTNEDGYASDPAVIAVGAVGNSGRAASYSSPGASLLLAAPGGEDELSLFTTDRVGRLGFNTLSLNDDLANYGFGQSGFIGTSAATPQIAGLAALVLSANPALAVRDVQQILLLSCRHFDLSDPELSENAAGLAVSRHVGFGVPDAAVAVDLATTWPPRPDFVRRVYRLNGPTDLIDDGLYVAIDGTDVPDSLRRIPAAPGQGLVPDQPTLSRPLSFQGRALDPITSDLSQQGALIQRGENLFQEKIQHAAAAGADFAIIYNNVGGDQRIRMGDTYYVDIPAVFIGQNDGERLLSTLNDQSDITAQLGLEGTEFTFTVPDSLLCEHVGVRVQTSHRRRGDLRIVLRSPQGTPSILQSVNFDDSPGPSDWTYFSTHHFYEPSAGNWTLTISDMTLNNTGAVHQLELIVYGVPITDQDTDGLADDWERAHFGNLTALAHEDPDHDGQSNLVEQLRDRDPLQSDLQLRVDLSRWSDTIVRLSWPSAKERQYQVQQFPGVTLPAITLETVPGTAFETEFFLPGPLDMNHFYRVLDTTQ